MAIFHLSVKAVSRMTGRSAVAAAAYRSGARLTNNRDGITHDFTRRSGVEAAFIVAPDGAGWAQDRSALWNAAEAAEKRKDAKVAREYEVALPAELSAEQRQDLAHTFAVALMERYGVAADVAIHAPGGDGDQRNHHAHILTTTRTVATEGLGVKTRQLDQANTASVEVELVRELWARLTNVALEQAGVGERVSHLSHAARGLKQVPTAHLGPAATAMERRRVETDRGDTNRAVDAHRKVQEAVTGNEVLLTNLDKAMRAAERLQVTQQASEWERRDQAALTRYRAVVEQAEAKGDEFEVVEQRGRLAKVEELVAAGHHPAHYGTAIIKAGELAVREWLQDQAKLSDQVQSGSEHQEPKQARSAADLVKIWADEHDRLAKNYRQRADRLEIRLDGQIRDITNQRYRAQIKHDEQRPQEPQGVFAAFKRGAYEKALAVWDAAKEQIKNWKREREEDLEKRLKRLAGYLSRRHIPGYDDKASVKANETLRRERPEWAVKLPEARAEYARQQAAAQEKQRQELEQDRTLGRGGGNGR